MSICYVPLSTQHAGHDLATDTRSQSLIAQTPYHEDG